MTLYCGVVKKHRANPTLASAAIDSYHLTRKSFQNLFKAVFETKVPPDIAEKLSAAERIRDRIMHGKSALDREKREAIYNVLSYAKEFNDSFIVCD